MLKTPSRKATTAKLLATVVLVGGAASVAGLGTFGAFTDTTQADQAVASGKVELILNGNPEAPTTTYAEIKGMVPGDYFHRAINLSRSAASGEFGSLAIIPTSTGHQPLIDALDVKVELCTVPWTTNENGVNCVGGTVTTVAQRVLDIDSRVDLPSQVLAGNLNSDARQLNVRATFTMVEQTDDIDNALQGKEAGISFKFLAQQRTAKNL